MGLEVEPSHRLALPPPDIAGNTQAYSLVLLGSRPTSGQLSKGWPIRTCTMANGKWEYERNRHGRGRQVGVIVCDPHGWEP